MCMYTFFLSILSKQLWQNYMYSSVAKWILLCLDRFVLAGSDGQDIECISLLNYVFIHIL